jgi:hypothetical protein
MKIICFRGFQSKSAYTYNPEFKIISRPESCHIGYMAGKVTEGSLFCRM